MSDILGLFMPMLRDGKDEFGTAEVPPLPLSVDRVMENRPLKSTAPLFKIPYELISDILYHVDEECLGNLALVNSDCRQLARSRQFASICFDYSPAASELISHLLDEKALRHQTSNAVVGIGGTIGPCIRRLTVATNPDWIRQLHNVELSEEFNALEKSVRDERLAKASEAFSTYLKRIESILSSRATLPHIELLDWEDQTTLQQPIFNSLTTSGIQHLKLFRVSVDREYEVIQPTVSDRWNLRTLDLDILWEIMSDRQGATSPLCSSLLRSCSHSLETLQWHATTREIYTFGTEQAKFPKFEALRNLRLGFLRFDGNGIVDALLEPSLSVLDLNHSRDNLVLEKALQRRGRVPSLETFIFCPSKTSIHAYLDFLKVNPQISKLSISGEIYREKEGDEDEETFEDSREGKILSIISSSFTTLTSLRIIWKARDTIIPDSALAVISGIKSLEQVCLGAGCQVGWKRDWLIDHEAMRKHLSFLPRLKKVAFSRDSYIFNSIMGETFPGGYYSERIPSMEEIRASRVRIGPTVEVWGQIFEDGHKKRMILEAEKYVVSLPNLDWIYIGEYPMAVIEASSKGRQPVPLCDERDGCSTLLSRIFGWVGTSSN